MKKGHAFTVHEVPAVFRTITTTPDTHSARKNNTSLLRAFADAGYAIIARAVGHDKSWLSRWLSGESVSNLPELLTMLDSAGLRIVHEDELASSTSDAEQVAALNAALSKLDGLSAAMKAMEEGNELHTALLALARRGLHSMQGET